VAFVVFVAYSLFLRDEVTGLQDEDFMREAIHIARFAAGRTSPNPLVGAVIVRNGDIIATGWHRKAGTPHAEIHALRMAGNLAKGATLYVTLEPCSHYGRTGPCAVAVAQSGIKRVVIGMQDPNPKVSGRGINILREAGIEVKCGVLENEVRKLNEVFLHWITTGKPFVIMKTAMTLDGKIATAQGESKWITNENSRYRTHELRDRYDAILVGIGTVLKDDPHLTARLHGKKGKNPIRVILDSKARTPLESHVLNDGEAPTIIAVTASAPARRIKALRERGAEVIQSGNGDQVDLQQLLKLLGDKEIASLLVEGGGRVNFSFLRAGLVNKVMAFVSPKILGGKDALTPVEGEGFAKLSQAVRLTDLHVEQLDGDLLIEGNVE
jgi:diaminohydroxyphosphoribosylaminopyrimidine deaminase/5-amino-6-(5-phosphoribosylamino)uracil reductase